MREVFIPRYSPLPIEDYSPRRGIGPAYSLNLRSDAEAWNLAWLSHPYEKQAEHIDPEFTRHVKYSVNMLRGTGAIDRVGRFGAGSTVRGLLRLPPNEFWFSINGSIAQRLPLYSIYGDQWLHTVMTRSQLPWKFADQESGLNIDEASRLLKKYTNVHI